MPLMGLLADDQRRQIRDKLADGDAPGKCAGVGSLCGLVPSGPGTLAVCCQHL